MIGQTMAYSQDPAADRRPLAAPGIHDLVAERMRRHPDAVAVEFAGRSHSYGELDRASAGIAATLGERLGDAYEPLVGVCVERSFEMIAALLGVLRAGAAYLPLDPDLPAARLAELVGEARPVLLLGRAEAIAAIGADGIAVQALDEAVMAAPAPIRPRAPAVPDPLAYVMYTSGSTGRPKGVEVRHSAVVNLVRSMAATPGIGEGDVLLAATRMTFDISVADFFWPLAHGARIALADQRTATDPKRLAALIASSGATVLQATPTTWRALVASGWAGEPCLRIVSGGEPLTRTLADQLLTRCRELWNLYGPTETTVWSTAYRVRPSVAAAVSIGDPIAETTLHILDESLRPAAPGAVGELCIGGAGLARGYRGRPDLTAERFPTLSSGERVYRTGDLARREPRDGALYCHGRIDDQVKIRGHRVEMGEVEAALARHPAVAACAVRCLPDAIGETSLVAYVVARGGEAPAPAALASFLRERLPGYMVPQRFIAIDALPLTPNGKIDRKALPDPAADRGLAMPKAEQTVRDAAAMLAAIWKDLLGLDAVGEDDDFFDLGGYSLLTVHLQCRVEESFGRSLSLPDLFAASSFDAMLRLIESEGEGADWRPLPLQPCGTRTPLYWLDGGPLLRVVARQMSADRPVLGVNLTTREETALSRSGFRLEQLAATLAARLRTTQPVGPLYLGGWCRWGIVAYETARQLVASGREVRKLILLDADCPTQGWRGWRRHASRLLRRSGGEAALGAPGGNSFSEEVELASQRYHPRRYAGAVSLMRPQSPSRHSLPDGGWGRLIPDLRIFVTPGDHLTMIRPPHAHHLAAALDEALEPRRR